MKIHKNSGKLLPMQADLRYLNLAVILKPSGTVNSNLIVLLFIIGNNQFHPHSGPFKYAFKPPFRTCRAQDLLPPSHAPSKCDHLIFESNSDRFVAAFGEDGSLFRRK
ncbi:MAG: hypothetical protein HZB50_19195 [Chloroflexi bacterium]|nr:hypothetical protein [Chloroflexota bacterium]